MDAEMTWTRTWSGRRDAAGVRAAGLRVRFFSRPPAVLV